MDLYWEKAKKIVSKSLLKYGGIAPLRVGYTDIIPSLVKCIKRFAGGIVGMMKRCKIR